MTYLFGFEYIQNSYAMARMEFMYRYRNTKICDGTIIDGNGCMQILSGHLKLIVVLSYLMGFIHIYPLRKCTCVRLSIRININI